MQQYYRVIGEVKSKKVNEIVSKNPEVILFGIDSNKVHLNSKGST
jgi:hypothetical protein